MYTTKKNSKKETSKKDQHSKSETKIESCLIPLLLQRENIVFSLIGQPFEIKLIVTKIGNMVTISIPGINTEFNNSCDTPLFTLANIGTLSCSSYVARVSQNIPLGGSLNTILSNIPKQFRHYNGLPISFFIASDAPSDSSYTGNIDRFGQLQILNSRNQSTNVGAFISYPSSVSYIIYPPPCVINSNFRVSNGKSNSNIYDVSTSTIVEVELKTSLSIDFGDYNDISQAFRNGKLYTTWSDNSKELEYNTPNQNVKSLAMSKISVSSTCKKTQIKVDAPINLSRGGGGESINSGVTYTNTSIAISPENEQVIVAVSEQRSLSGNGFLFTISMDDGQTWSKKIIATGTSPDKLPPGGLFPRIHFDRFGSIYIIYTHRSNVQNSIGFVHDHVYLIYSADKGSSFRVLIDVYLSGTLPAGVPIIFPSPLSILSVPVGYNPNFIFTQNSSPTDPMTVAASGFGFSDFAIGPDSKFTNADSVWIAVNLALNGINTNSTIHIIGLRIPNLNMFDMNSLRTFTIAGDGIYSAMAVSIDVGANGQVGLLAQQSSVSGTFYDLPYSNVKLYLYSNPLGLVGDFSQRRNIVQTNLGTRIFPPVQPHRGLIANGNIVIDRNQTHQGRMYVSFLDRPNQINFNLRPYLTWSDNSGQSWSPPLLVSDLCSSDDPNITEFLLSLSIDPTSGTVATTFFSTRCDTGTLGFEGERDSIKGTDVYFMANVLLASELE